MALGAIGLQAYLPINESSFLHWLCDTREKLVESQRRGFVTIATLVAWIIWKEKNNRIFNHQHKAWLEIARAISAEAELWRLANSAMPALLL
uniref:Uncharacterized protein n=1 Tax=Oryza glumipatula TaxID=40148 RepID=A0A0E0BC02_9ORYZ